MVKNLKVAFMFFVYTLREGFILLTTETLRKKTAKEKSSKSELKYSKEKDNIYKQLINLRVKSQKKMNFTPITLK